MGSVCEISYIERVKGLTGGLMRLISYFELTCSYLLILMKTEIPPWKEKKIFILIITL